MFARLQSGAQNVPQLERVEALVRARFRVAEDQIVLVREEPSTLPRLPARSTVILFWTGPEARHRIRIFKPAAAVIAADLPAPWLQNAIRDDGENDCC